MINNKILRKICSVSLSAAMITSVGLMTTNGNFLGMNTQVNAYYNYWNHKVPVSYRTYNDFYCGIFEDNTIVIERYVGNASELVIPSTLDGKTVTHIECPNLDYSENFNSSVTSITIPDTVVDIYPGAFSAFKSLTEIKTDRNNPYFTAENGVLFNKDKTELLAYPAAKKGKYTVPSNVTFVQEYAFERCTGLTSLVISDGVEFIDNHIIENCTNLTSVSIGKNVSSIYVNFDNCPKLTAINVDKNNQEYTSVDGVLFSKDKKTIVRYPEGKSGAYTVPYGTEALDFCSFLNCTKLTDISLPYGLTRISEFTNCIGLTSIKIPKTVTELYGRMFVGCKNLHKVIVPTSTTWEFASGYGTFEDCNSDITLFSADEIVLGETVTINPAPYWDRNYDTSTNLEDTYAVFVKKTSEKKWTVKQDFDSNDTITFKPAKATDYDICVKIKHPNGKIVKKYFTLKVNNKLQNTSAVSAATIKKGNTVTVTGSVTGGVGECRYSVLYKKKSEKKWTVRQDYQENNEITVKPAVATDYNICIKAQDDNGTISKKYFDVTVK